MKKGLEFAVSFAGVLTMSGSLALLPSIFGDDALQAQPAQASISGSASSFTTGNNLLTTVSGSVTLPAGLFFNGNVIINPVYDTQNRVGRLELIVPDIDVVPRQSTFSRAAAGVINQIILGNASVIRNIEALSAIIRAGAGADGLD